MMARVRYIVFPEGKTFTSEADAIRFARKLAKQPGTASVEIYRSSDENDPFWIWSGGIVKNGRIFWNLWRGEAKNR